MIYCRPKQTRSLKEGLWLVASYVVFVFPKEKKPCAFDVGT